MLGTALQNAFLRSKSSIAPAGNLTDGLKMLVTKIASDNHTEVTLAVMKKPPNKRSVEELLALVQATSYLDYFRQIIEDGTDAKKKLHYDCCRHMYNLCKLRGEAVIKVGEVADRFFIILSGRVAIFKPRLAADIQNDKLVVNSLTEIVNEKYPQESNIKTQFLVNDIATLSPVLQKRILDKVASVNKSSVTFNEEYLLEILGPSAKQDLQTIPDFFDSKGICQMEYIGSLAQGSCFGDKGLDNNTPRTATIICQTNCHFAVIMKEDYNTILKEFNLNENDRQKKYFYETVFQKNLGSGISSKLAYEFNKNKVSYGHKHVLYRQGTRSDAVYVLESGSCILYRKEHRLVQPGTLIRCKDIPIIHKLAIISPGTMFGFEDLFNKKETRFYSCQTVMPCTFYKITREAFMKNMDQEELLKTYIQGKAAQINAHRLELLKKLESFQVNIDSQNPPPYEKPKFSLPITAIVRIEPENHTGIQMPAKMIIQSKKPKQTAQTPTTATTAATNEKSVREDLPMTSEDPNQQNGSLWHEKSVVKPGAELRKAFIGLGSASSRTSSASKSQEAINEEVTAHLLNQKALQIAKENKVKIELSRDLVERIRKEEADTQKAMEEYIENLPHDETFMEKCYMDKIKRAKLREKYTFVSTEKKKPGGSISARGPTSEGGKKIDVCKSFVLRSRKSVEAIEDKPRIGPFARSLGSELLSSVKKRDDFSAEFRKFKESLEQSSLSIRSNANPNSNSMNLANSGLPIPRISLRIKPFSPIKQPLSSNRKPTSNQ
jgi:CRP-like cAMP-binding protein